MNPHATAENIVNEVEYFQRLERAGVPEHLREGLVRYLVHRIQPGHFLTAVLENNLIMAIARCDEASAAGLPAIIRFLVNHAPGEASGSPATVREWLLAGHEMDVDLTLGVDTSALERAVDRAVDTTIDKLRGQRDQLLTVACAAYHALKSYECGNASPDLARTVAAALDDEIARVEGRQSEEPPAEVREAWEAENHARAREWGE